MKKNLVILGLLLTILIPQSSNAIVFFNDQDDAIKLKPNYPAAGLSITDDRVLTQVSAITGASRGTFVTNLACNSVTDPRCSGADNLRVSAVIPPCTAKSDAQDVCIKSLRTADSTGALKDAQLLYEIDTFKFPRDTASRIPAGGGISVWRGSSIKGGTLEYSVAVDIQINYYRTSPSSPTSSVYVVGFSAQVLPTTTKNGNFYPLIWRDGFESIDNPKNGEVDQSYRSCIWTDLGRCGMAEPFFADQPIELTMQMDNKLTGWLFGRMKDTRASVTRLSPTTSTLVVSGASINVPSGISWIPKSEFATSPALQEMNYDGRVENDVYGPGIMWGKFSNHPDLFEFPRFGMAGGGIHTPNPALKGTGYFQASEKWLQTANVLPTWRFQGMDPSSFWGMDQSVGNRVWECTVKDQTKLHGMMTTNAMAYSWSPPAFKDGIMSYKVAGAHLDADGSVYKGTYDLAMNADSARCIYGFSNAPIKASVSVLSSGGGEQEISTETLSIKDGWMNLSAKNFTFSSPTIRIKLTQEQAPVAATNNSPSTPNAAAKPAAPRITITCVKGKSVKKVSGVNPKCPSGFKKR